MKFKVGDKVVILDEEAIGRVVEVDDGSIPYKVKVNNACSWHDADDLDLVSRPCDRTTERRLIEVLRKFAKLYTEDGRPIYANIAACYAANLLRELGEYPETCDKCGQEIRK